MRNAIDGDFTEEEAAAQKMLEGQLTYTANMALENIKNHPHYTDDCGEYLRSALELSAYLMSEREEGIESFTKFLNDKRDEEEGKEDDDNHWLLNDYASDGIAPEVYAYFNITP